MASKLPYMLKGTTSGVSVLAGGTVVPRETLPIITKPLNFTKKIERIKEAIDKKKELKQRRQEYLQTQELIISCKNRELNFYRGQTFSKFGVVPLASRGWRTKKSNGDNFVIRSTSKNPATLDQDQSFEDLGLCPEIVNALKNMGMMKPTNIQSAAIPVISSGKNTLMAAETGNGKTLAFMLPLLQKVWELKQAHQLQDRSFNSPLVLVVVPSRELAVQIEEICKMVASPLGLNIESVVGAERTRLKIRDPKMTHPDVLIASLGVLSKLITNRIVNTSYIRHVVLDEADTLLDDSFTEKMSYVLKWMPIRRKDEDADGAQLVLAGATLPRSLDSKLERIVEVDSLERVMTSFLHRSLPHVTQRFYRMSVTNKIEAVLDMAREAHKKSRPTIIFSNSSDTVNWLGHTLKEHDIDCVHVTGKLHSSHRKELYYRFIEGESNLISCTDLLSRGLDTISAEHVINYDFPKYSADYIHRCGRVGRVGSRCNSPLVTNFICKIAEAELAQAIEYTVRRAEALPNVNANIKRLYNAERVRIEKETEHKEERREKKRVKRQSLRNLDNEKFDDALPGKEQSVNLS